jgi:AraC-like DNA-binding protein
MPESAVECKPNPRFDRYGLTPPGRALNMRPGARAAACLGNTILASGESDPGLDSNGVPAVSRRKRLGRLGFPRWVSRRIEEFVDARLETRVDIAQLAVIFGYSSSHFFRMFRRTFGITPHTYVMRRRMTLAQDLLTATDLCLAEVALRAGFCDQSHLSRSFRQFVGVPPRAFRLQQRLFADPRRPLPQRRK